jgi:hypothetical protein
MQVFHETVQLLDPPLREGPTPSQRLFRAYLRGGEPELEREYERMYPSKPASSTPIPI